MASEKKGGTAKRILRPFTGRRIFCVLPKNTHLKNAITI
jgi:hypothetical protein